ncbi:MAG: von Willebrand factor type A domain-containing protein [Bacteroidales bacterium]|nr:von Willebrand factor type A domain-containing protein [Bacteroidales bacterium]MBN2699539.1 von Willebrand factor type A domain-containing protein [Bacteroidales bacterium]
MKSNLKPDVMKTIISFLVIFVLSSFYVFPGQNRVVSGTVTDENGHALPGVSVVIKNTSRGTLTDYSGTYSITVNPSDKILVFSYIGYETLEVKIGEQVRVNVRMIPSSEALEEVVVTGYGAVSVQMPELSRGERKSGNYSQMVSLAVADNSGYYRGMHVPHPDWNTEGYSAIHENGFRDVLHNPLSTFSIDVDKASYSNIRRFINMGQMPPKDAVRIEEMINYFSYDYPEPKGEHPFSVYTELSACPWNPGHQLLHIGLKGKSIDKSKLPPSNLVFLIDVSGSMNSPNKLPLLKNAFTLLVKELRPEDRVAIVVYAGAAGLVLEPTTGSEKDKMLTAINDLQSGGSTAGGAGLRLAYKTAEEHFIENGNNRIILATDGDFNVGVSSNAEMERLVEEKREKGIFMTVLGFGMGNYKDDKMEIIADKGNGNYAYIDNIQEARKVFVTEFGGTLFIIAKDVKFQVEFNPARVKEYRLVGYENRLLNDEDFNDDRKDAGEMGAGHTVTALYELIPTGSEEETVSIDPLKYQPNRKPADLKAARELMTVKLRYKKSDEETSTKVEIPIKGELLDIEGTSDSFRFSAAVAEFGMILRDSEFKAEGSIARVIELAKGAKGVDEEGYRSEFLRLVKTSEAIN